MKLLSNAIKYTNEGQITLKVEALTNQEKCQLTISVTDTGVGMSKESIDNIFVKFQRFDIDKYTDIEGTGLGMAITKGLIDLMNGEIKIESELGKGSTFTIKLDQDISTKNIDEVLTSYTATFNPFDASGQKVLVVDDNQVNLKVAEHFLEQYKLDLSFCTSGKECLDRVHQGEQYDLILLDIMMPRMKGTDVIKELVTIPGFNTPVVALTADVMSDLGSNYREYGFAAVVSKPIVEEDLFNVLRQYLKDNTDNNTQNRQNEPINQVDETTKNIAFEDLPAVNYNSEMQNQTQITMDKE